MARGASGTYIRNPRRRCINIVTLNVAASSEEAPVINRKPIITGYDVVKQINPTLRRRSFLILRAHRLGREGIDAL